MYAASIHYDVTGVARLEARRLESSYGLAKIKHVIFGSLVTISPQRMLEAVARYIGERMVQMIQRDTLKLQSFTLQFRTLRAELALEMQTTGLQADQATVASLTRLQGTLLSQQGNLYKLCEQISRVRPESRVHKELARQLNVLVELSDTVHQLRLVALGAGAIADMSWEESIRSSHQNFLAVTKSLDSEDEDYDPELLALAEEAVTAAENRKTMEPGWASSLAGSPYH